MNYRLLRIKSPLSANTGPFELENGEISLPDLEPGETAKARMKVTKHFFESDILEIKASDKFGHSMCTWTWPVHYANDYFERENREYHKVGEASCVEEGNNVTLSADGIHVSFDKLT